jgi:DNA polymerase II large subunit
VYSSYSDARLKVNLVPIDDALAKLLNLSAVYYNQNEMLAEELDLKPNNKRQIGLIAQEVNEVFPELIGLAGFDLDPETGLSKSGEDYMTLLYPRLVPVLVKAIQELNAKVDLLQNQLNLRG